MTMTLHDQVQLQFEYKISVRRAQKTHSRLSAEMNQFILLHKIIDAASENHMEKIQPVPG